MAYSPSHAVTKREPNAKDYYMTQRDKTLRGSFDNFRDRAAV
jgi:hypothetical protein